MENIKQSHPNISTTYRSVKMRQEDLEHKRKEADEKLKKLRELVEQVN